MLDGFCRSVHGKNWWALCIPLRWFAEAADSGEEFGEFGVAVVPPVG